MSATIHVGDCLEVMRGMPDASIDAVVTDPPYGMSYQSARPTHGPRFAEIVGDDKPAIGFLAEACRLLRNQGAAFVFCEWRNAEAFRAEIERCGLTVRSQVVWDREVHGMGDPNAVFAPCHDLAWFATKGSGFSFCGPRPQSVLRFPRVPASKLTHPAEKPVALMRHIVSRLCPPGGVCLDPYAGSGTTGVACVMEGRGAVLCEMVPEYASMAKARVASALEASDWKNPRQGGLFVTAKEGKA